MLQEKSILGAVIITGNAEELDEMLERATTRLAERKVAEETVVKQLVLVDKLEKRVVRFETVTTKQVFLAHNPSVLMLPENMLNRDARDISANIQDWRNGVVGDTSFEQLKDAAANDKRIKCCAVTIGLTFQVSLMCVIMSNGLTAAFVVSSEVEKDFDVGSLIGMDYYEVARTTQPHIIGPIPQ